MPLFSHAADLWLVSKAGLAPKSKERYEQCVANLKEEFGKALVYDVDANDSAEYRASRYRRQRRSGTATSAHRPSKPRFRLLNFEQSNLIYRRQGTKSRTVPEALVE